MTREEIERLDPKGMSDWIAGFPNHVEEAVRIGTHAPVKLNVRGVKNIVLTGLGGSAIGGDLLRSYLLRDLKVPFIVNRNYLLPHFVGTDTLVIVSSYSGNTEETIAAHRDATKRKARVLCISTGGATASFARKHKQPVITVPGGLSPRAALGYSFFPLLVVLSRLGFIRSKAGEIRETITLLRKLSAAYSDPTAADNAPLRLAEKFKGAVPVIYSPTDHFDTVNLRWRGQIAENAKQLGFGNLLPEMNHNEVVGWKVNGEFLKKIQVVFLRDVGTHPRVKAREEITKLIVTRHAGGVTEVHSTGTSLLARMFSLVHFGDWVTLYLAILNNEDPEPVEVIDFLKHELSKV